MLYYLHKLAGLGEGLGFLNVFQYHTIRALGAAVTSLLICIWVGPAAIRILTRLKLGQPLRSKEEVHKLADLHSSKKGTPTMGGILILASVTISALLWCRPTNPYVWLVLISMLYLGGIGFLDDYLKVTKKKSDGMAGRQKLVAQFMLAALVTACLKFNPETAEHASKLYIPFWKQPLVEMGLFLGFLFFALVIMGSSNAVNLTDGLDGLAAGCTVTVASVYAIFTYVAGNAKFARYLLIPYVPGASELTVFCAALVGASLGFLWWNCHPAKVFMGDTGSLAIGGALAVIAICVHQELVLVIAGGVFVMEAGSVLLQVGWFKATGGKRLFAMSPIHHHFELRGWNESTVTIRFWILSILFALLALSTLKLR